MFPALYAVLDPILKPEPAGFARKLVEAGVQLLQLRDKRGSSRRMYEQARELSISLLKEWLVKYKFKNWKTTQTRKLPVTKAMRVARAEEIAKALNKIAKWNSHGRGIPMAVLRKDLKLIIEDFGSDADLNASIKDYHKLLQNYLATVHHDHVVQTRNDFIALGRSS